MLQVYIILTFVVQGKVICHLVVGKLSPGFEYSKLSVVDLLQPIQSTLHSGGHATRIIIGEIHIRIVVEDQLVGESVRTAQDVIEDGPADVRFRAIRVAIPLSKRDGNRLLRIVKVLLRQHLGRLE